MLSRHQKAPTSDNHDKVVKKAKANEGEGVVIS